MMSIRQEHLSQIASHVSDKQLIHRLQQLDRACSEIETYYHEYDYKDIPCNGFRTFVKVSGLFVAALSEISQAGKGLNDGILRDYAVVSELLCINAEAAALIRKKGHDYPLQCTDLDCEILRKFTLIEPRHMEPLYGNIGPFYIKPDFRDLGLQSLTTLHILIAPFLEKAKMLLSHRYRSKRQSMNAIDMTLDIVKMMKSLDQFPLNFILKLAVRPNSSCTTEWISIPRNLNKWTIHLPDVRSPAVIQKKTERSSGDANKEKTGLPIDCMLIKPKSGYRNGSKSIIIHLPSGGMILALANVYTTLMSRISRDLGIPVVVAKYALAPENPYPAAVQDVLDLYMFFASGDPKVAQLLGFYPESILLSGDSAGGYLATVCTIALNEIKRLGGEVRMPKALALQYPAMTIGFVPSPGMTMNGLDISTTFGELRFAVSAYAQVEPEINLNQPLDKDAASMDEIMKRFNDRLKDPLYTPLIYQHFDGMKDIPLSLLACEMDCVIDHTIDIAKKWPGPVTLDVGWGLPHGFPAADETAATAAENQQLIQRLASSLAIPVP